MVDSNVKKKGATTMNKVKIVLPIALVAFVSMAQDASWIPSGATGAASIDAKALRAMPVWKTLSKESECGGINVPIVDKCNIADDFKDLRDKTDKALVGFFGDGNAEPRACAYLTGTFDSNALVAKMKADGFKAETIEGVQSWVNVAENTWAAFPRQGLAVFANDANTFALALRTMQKKAPGLSSDSMVARAIAKNFPIAAASDATAFFPKGEALPMVGTPPPSFIGFSLRQKDAAAAIANVTGIFSSDDDAKALADALNGLKMISIMKMSSDPNGAAMAKLLNAVAISSTGKNAVVSATIDEATLAALKAAK